MYRSAVADHVADRRRHGRGHASTGHGGERLCRSAGLEWGRPGTGAPVLCLHGFPQRSTSWTGVGERLADAGLRTIAVDQRGYSPGARPLDVAAYAMPHLVADVVGIIEALGGRVHLVGHDWGGVVGWQVAARRPDLVRDLDGGVDAEPGGAQRGARRRPGGARAIRLHPGVARSGAPSSGCQPTTGRDCTAFYQGRVAPDRVAEDVAFFAQPGVLTAALNWYRAMSPADAAGLGPVTVPTTYVWGSDDLAFSPAAAAADRALRQPGRTGSYRSRAPATGCRTRRRTRWPRRSPNRCSMAERGRAVGDGAGPRPGRVLPRHDAPGRPVAGRGRLGVERAGRLGAGVARGDAGRGGAGAALRADPARPRRR